MVIPSTTRVLSRWLRTVGLLYLSVFMVSVALLFPTFNLGEADLHVPFSYSGDAVFAGALVKGAQTTGRILRIRTSGHQVR